MIFNDSKRRTTQRKWIARARRRCTHRKARDERIKLVRQRNRAPRQVARNRIVKSERLVVVVNRPGNLVRLALRARVEPTNNSLQLGKLLHHLRDEIALRKFRRAIRSRHIATRNSGTEPLLRKPASDRAHALHFVEITSEPALVGNVRELRQVVGEPTLLIRLPEKLRVRKARTQHSLVSRPHQPLRVFVEIYHREKIRCQPPAASFQRKIFLMVAHHRNQNLIRQRQKIRIEIAGNHGGIFVEISHDLK